MVEALVTGFPSLVARRLCAELLSRGDNIQILTRHRHKQAAERLAKEHPGPGRAEVLVGDVVLMDLGLGAPAVRDLLSRVEHVYHLASVREASRHAAEAQGVHVKGTQTVLELALSMDRIARFSFLSSAFVSGDRTGVVMESELESGQSFRTPFEQTKFEAEKRVRRAAADLPVSIFRPSVVVGDSKSGQFYREDDPWSLLLAFLRAPQGVPMPLPGHGSYPLHLVPVDYVVQATIQLSRDPRAAGQTFHLTDPNPLPARRVCELVAEHTGAAKPRGAIPAGLARRLLALPWLRKITPEPEVVDHFNHLVIYNTINTLDLLSGTDLRCPPFESYVGHLVAHLQTQGRSLEADHAQKTR